jgi:hypothetical protein
MHPRTWKCLAFVTVVALFAAARPAAAADAKKGDVTGTWTWSTQGQGGQTFEQKAKLKQDGEKVTGVIVGRNNQETEIKEGKLKDGELHFDVTRERNGQSMTIHYKGKVDGDSIKGTSEREGGQSREWVAKRAKDEK